MRDDGRRDSAATRAKTDDRLYRAGRWVIRLFGDRTVSTLGGEGGFVIQEADQPLTSRRRPPPSFVCHAIRGRVVRSPAKRSGRRPLSRARCCSQPAGNKSQAPHGKGHRVRANRDQRKRNNKRQASTQGELRRQSTTQGGLRIQEILNFIVNTWGRASGSSPTRRVSKPGVLLSPQIVGT